MLCEFCHNVAILLYSIFIMPVPVLNFNDLPQGSFLSIPEKIDNAVEDRALIGWLRNRYNIPNENIGRIDRVRQLIGELVKPAGMGGGLGGPVLYHVKVRSVAHPTLVGVFCSASVQIPPELVLNEKYFFKDLSDNPAKWPPNVDEALVPILPFRARKKSRDPAAYLITCRMLYRLPESVRDNILARPA